MHRSLRFALVAAALLLALPAAAGAAGTGDQSGAPGGPSPSAGVRAYVAVDLNVVAAKQSFDAVLGTSQLTAFGGGVDVVDIWKHLFARVAVTRARKTGSRAFVANGQVFPLNIPLTVTMTPVEAGGGWRFVKGRVTPYAGAAFVSMGYTETSEFAQAGEDTAERFSGQEVFGGAEFGIMKWLVAAAEAQYRRVPNALGAGGLSREFAETDLGGFTARVTIGVRLR